MRPETRDELEDLSYNELQKLGKELGGVGTNLKKHQLVERIAEKFEQEEGDVSEDVSVGVKLGSTRTVIATRRGDGLDIVRSLTCIATYDDILTGEEQIVYGEEAATEYADRVTFMMRSGLPEDADSAELASKFFNELLANNDVPEDSAAVYAIPTMENEEGLNNLQRVIEGSPLGKKVMKSYPESLCGSIPAFGDGLEAIETTFIAVNLGSTNLEASAYRRGEQIEPLATGAVTGNEVDRHIASLVEEETQGRVNIDRTTAREYKEQHADFENFQPFTDVIQQPGGGAHEFTIERSIMEAMNEYLDEVVDKIANTFLPELANDYMKVYQNALDEKIAVTGGMACIPGLVDEFQKRLSEEIQRDVEAVSPDRPDLSAAIGAERIAHRLMEMQ